VRASTLDEIGDKERRPSEASRRVPLIGDDDDAGDEEHGPRAPPTSSAAWARAAAAHRLSQSLDFWTLTRVPGAPAPCGARRARRVDQTVEVDARPEDQAAHGRCMTSLAPRRARPATRNIAERCSPALSRPPCCRG